MSRPLAPNTIPSSTANGGGSQWQATHEPSTARTALVPVPSVVLVRTFKVAVDPLGHLDDTAIVDVRRGGLEKEEGLFRNRVPELLCVISVVAPDPTRKRKEVSDLNRGRHANRSIYRQPRPRANFPLKSLFPQTHAIILRPVVRKVDAIVPLSLTTRKKVARVCFRQSG